METKYPSMKINFPIKQHTHPPPKKSPQNPPSFPNTTASFQSDTLNHQYTPTMFSLITLTSTALALSTLLLSTNANPTPVLQARDHFVSLQSPHPPAAYQTQTDSILSRSSTA